MRVSRSITGFRAGFGSLGLLIVCCMGILAGCGLVDSNDPQHPTPTSIRDYYVKLEDTSARYSYYQNQKSSFFTGIDTLSMHMTGPDSGPASMWGERYSCDWKMTYSPNPISWYYAVSDSMAVDLGPWATDSDPWIELKTPLVKDSSWTFVNSGETITAKITSIVNSAFVAGKSYSDVIVVTYKGNQSFVGTRWFARGLGVIYRKDTSSSAFIEEHLLSAQAN